MELLFHRVYEVADLMAANVDAYSFEELDWDSQVVSACLAKFSKLSLLSHFCFSHLCIHDRRTWRKDPETVDIELAELAFERYAISHMSFNDFLRRNFPHAQMDEDTRQDALYPWMLDQDEAFYQLWERITDEVFHLLFGNRNFLLDFNLHLADLPPNFA